MKWIRIRPNDMDPTGIGFTKLIYSEMSPLAEITFLSIAQKLMNCFLLDRKSNV